MKTLFLLAFLTLLPFPAFAEPYTHAPDNCEFQITFPEKPYIQDLCDGGDNGDQCYQKTSYTQVYDLDATVKTTVTCSAIDQAINDSYSKDIMVETLKVMTANEVSEIYQTTFSEEENYKVAAIIGQGQMGQTETIYIAQLWIGQTSAFSLEGEIGGEQHEQADLLFRDILQSVQYKSEAPSQTDKSPNVTAP